MVMSLLVLLFAVTGTLKGYDQLLNLVLDGAVEFVRGKNCFLLPSFVILSVWLIAQHYTTSLGCLETTLLLCNAMKESLVLLICMMVCIQYCDLCLMFDQIMMIP